MNALTGLTDRLLGLLRRVGAVLPGGRATQVLVAGAVVLAAGAAGTKLYLDRAEELPHDAVFRVHGKVFTQEQFEQRVSLVELLYGVSKPTEAAKVDEFNRTVAKAVAVSLIVEEAARERDIVIADKAASDRLGQLIADSGMDRRAFIQHLGSRGLSEGDVLEEVKFQQANARLFTQVTKSVRPTTDADARRYFDEHRAELATPESRGLVNIVVTSKDQATRVARLARSGTDFAALVERYSIDESTKSHGGSLGVVQAEQLDTGYAAEAFAAARGEIFGPVRTEHGWNIGRVTDVRRPEPVSFARIRDVLKSKLDYDAQLKVWNAFLSDRIRAADVVYAADYRPDEPDALPASPLGG